MRRWIVLVVMCSILPPLLGFAIFRGSRRAEHRAREQEERSGRARQTDFVVIEDFETAELGGLPPGWKARGWDQVEAVPYRVEEEKANRFLRAEDTGQNVILYKRFRWNIRDYPYISWRWRIRAVPKGADERTEARADSAAGLYLTYGRRLGLIPRSIKFVWSGSLPAGSAFRRPGIGMPWTIVAGSGAEPDTEWRSFVFNALEAYRKTFGGTPGRRPLGIGILSDANNTGTRAFADYDDIIALRRADAPLSILRFLEAN